MTSVEMTRNRQRGFCCGGGGGRFWMEDREGTRMNDTRTEQIMETGASIVATACPFCLQMFVDGIKSKETEDTEGFLQAKDVAELMMEAIEGATPAVDAPKEPEKPKEEVTSEAPAQEEAAETPSEEKTEESSSE